MKLKRIIISLLIILLGSSGLLFGCTSKPLNLKIVQDENLISSSASGVVGEIKLKLPTGLEENLDPEEEPEEEPEVEEPEGDEETAIEPEGPEITDTAIFSVLAENPNSMLENGLDITYSENNIVKVEKIGASSSGYEYEITALYPKNVLITFTTKDRKEKISVNVVVEQDVNKIELNPTSKNFVTFGEEKEISTNVITFSPSTTTNKDVVFELAESYEGIYIEDNKFKFSDGYDFVSLYSNKVDKILVKAIHSKYNELEPNANFVVENIVFDILAPIGDLAIVDAYNAAVNLNFFTNSSNNEDNYKTIYIKQRKIVSGDIVYEDIDSSYEIKYYFKSNQELVSVEKSANKNEFIISQNFRDGTDTIVFYTENKIQPESESKIIERQITVSTKANYISINGQRNPEQIILYDNGTPREIEVVVGPDNAKETRFKINPINKPTPLTFKYTNGLTVDLENDVILSGTKILVSCDYIEYGGTVTVEFVTYDGLTKTSVTFNVMKDLKDGDVAIEGDTNISKINDQGNNTLETFTIAPTTIGIYIPTYEIEIENENIVSLNNINYNNKTFTLKALTTGTTNVKVKFDNGLEKEFTVNVYMPVEEFKLDIDSNYTSNLGEIVTTNGSITKLIIKKDKTVKLKVKAYDISGGIISNFSNYSISYVSLNNDANFAISNLDNTITAIKETLTDILVKATIIAIGSTGNFEEFKLEFSVGVYIPIESVTLSDSYVSLYAKETLGSSDENLSVKTFNFTVFPSNATALKTIGNISASSNFASEVSLFEGDQSRELSSRLDVSNNIISLTIGPVSIGTVNQSTGTLTFSIQEYSVIYSKKVTVKIENAVQPTHILLDNLNKLESETGEEEYLYFNLNLNEVCETNLNPRVFPLDSYTLDYDVTIRNISSGLEDVVSFDKSTGVISALSPGECTVTFKARGNDTISKTITVKVGDGSKEYPYAIRNKEDLLLLTSTDIMFGNNGESVAEINEQKEIQKQKYTKHYQLIADINLTGVDVYPIGMYRYETPMDPFVLEEFTGGFNGEFKINNISQSFTISGISINKDFAELVVYEKINTINLGLFAEIGETAVVENLNVSYSYVNIIGSRFVKEDVSATTSQDITFNFGGIAGINKGTIKNCSSSIHFGEIITYYNNNNIGMITGMNNENAKVINCKVRGNLNVLDGANKYKKDYPEANNLANEKVILAGGVVGLNAGKIEDTFKIYASEEQIFNKNNITSTVNLTGIYNVEILQLSEESAFGGIVGENTSTGIIGYYNNDILTGLGVSSYGNIIAYNNVGGVAGKNRGSINSSFSASSVTGVNNIGGLVGLYEGGELNNNAVMFLNDGTTDAKIIGAEYVAGLIGKTKNDAGFVGKNNFVQSYISKDGYYDVVVTGDNYGALYSGNNNTTIDSNFANFKLKTSSEEKVYNGSISGLGIIAPESLNVSINETNLTQSTIGSLNKFINANNEAIILYYYSDNTKLNEHLLNFILEISYAYTSEVQDYQKLEFTKIESLNKDIIKIDDNGKLIVLKAGDAQIKITSMLNEDASEVVKIKVIEKISNLELYFDSLFKNSLKEIEYIEKDKSYNLYLDDFVKQNDVYIAYMVSSEKVVEFNTNIADEVYEGIKLYKATKTQIIKGLSTGTVNVVAKLYLNLNGNFVELPAVKSFNVSVKDGLNEANLDITKGTLIMNSSLDAVLEINTDIVDKTNISLEQSVKETEANCGKTFTNDYLNIVSERKIVNNELVYNFKFSLNKNKNINEIIDETILIKIYIFDNFVSLNAVKENEAEFENYIKTIEIKVEANNLINLNMSYFADGEIIKDEVGNDVLNENELESNFIKIGKIGILKINIYPIENLQSLSISYENDSNLNLSLKQVKKVGSSYQDVDTAILNGKTLTLDINPQNINEGYLYLKLLTDSPIKEGSVYTLKVRINNLSYYFEKQLTTKLSTNLELTYNNALLNSNGVLEGVVAKDVENQKISLRVTKLNPSDRKEVIIVSKNNNVSLPLLSETKISNDEYILDFALQGLINAGNGTNNEYVEIYYYIDKIVNGKTERYISNKLKLNIVDFVVNSVSIENVSDGYLTKPYGTDYELKVKLNTTNNNDPSVLSQIEKLEEEISKGIESNPWYKNGELLTVGNYGHFKISKQNGYFVVTPQEIFRGYNLSANFAIEYSNGQVLYKSLEYQNSNKEVYIENQNYCIKFKENFGLNFYLQTDINNPVPIYNQNDFVSMKPNANYILMNDLSLEDYTIQTASFNSLDGNNKTITLKSFNLDLTTVQNEIKFGLFDEINENSLIKNLKVKFDLNVTTNSNFVESNNINLTNIKTLYFGAIAGINNGLIYNCEILSNKGNNLDVFNITVSNIIEDVQTNAYIGGIVAENNGFITNTRTELKLAINKGIVAGFASINNGTISSSYYKNSFIKNLGEDETTSSTAGFVNRNSGAIKYSYVEGETNFKNEDGIYIANEQLSKYNIITSTSVGGFVYSNEGEIEDCYSNLSLTSQSFSGGFIYTNEGTITRSYAATATEKDNDAHAPFIATKVEINKEEMKKLIVDCFYLNNGKSTVNDSLVTGLSLSQFNDEYYLTNFVIGLENGIWSFRENSTPTLIEANNIAVSQRKLYSSYVNGDGSTVYNYVYERYYMGHEQNPIIISNEEEFIYYFTVTGLGGRNNYYYRLIKNINFSEYSNLPTIFYTFSGRLDGNGLSISNLSISAPSGFSGNSFGLFAKIEKAEDGGLNPIVKNLNISPLEVYANNVQKVGTLAGNINNADIINVNVNANGVIVQGKNIVGGVVGEITGDSKLINVTSNISTNANYVNNKGTKVYIKDQEENNKNIAYAGNICGVIDTSLTTNGNENVRNIKVYEGTFAIGEFTGLAFGLICENSGVDSVKVYVNGSTYLNSLYAAGIVVGENRGYISRAETINNIKANNLALFRNTTNAIGGIVGFNNNGSVVNSIAKVDVVSENRSTVVAGGVIGITVGGSISSVIANNKVSSYKTMGGIIGASVDRSLLLETSQNKYKIYLLDGEDNKAINEQTIKSNYIVYIANSIALNTYGVDDSILADEGKAVGAMIGAVHNNLQSTGDDGALGLQVKNSYITENNYYKNLTYETSKLKDYGVHSIGSLNDITNKNNETDASYYCATPIESTSETKIFERFSLNVFDGLALTAKDALEGTLPTLKTKNNINTKKLEGEGTYSNPYEVNSINAINELAKKVNNGNNKVYVNLTDNIEATGKEISSIGSIVAFDGVFNGNNKYINGLTYINDKNKYSTQNFFGLFAQIGANANVSNLNIVANFVINYGSNVNYTGTVAGINRGIISNCNVYGGIVGYLQNIANSNALSYVGGVVGLNAGGIQTGVVNCFNHSIIYVTIFDEEEINIEYNNINIYAGYIAGASINKAVINKCENKSLKNISLNSGAGNFTLIVMNTIKGENNNNYVGNIAGYMEGATNDNNGVIQNNATVIKWNIYSVSHVTYLNNTKFEANFGLREIYIANSKISYGEKVTIKILEDKILITNTKASNFVTGDEEKYKIEIYHNSYETLTKAINDEDVEIECRKDSISVYYVDGAYETYKADGSTETGVIED